MSNSETDPDPLWRAFAQMRVEEGNLNDHLDLPHLLQLIPPGEGNCALDLGCGLGQASIKLAEEFSYTVVAVDFNSEFLDYAKNSYSGSRITWLHSTFDDLNFKRANFSLIVSCLAFHFVEDLSTLINNCAKWLGPGGKLIFSVRHPIRTSNPGGQIAVDGRVGWIVKDYFTQPYRECLWLGQRCVNFHRPLSAYFHMLTGAGLKIDTVVEPSMCETSSHPSAGESQSVPFFLLISCGKPDYAKGCG
jgi:SAM-dependent methyltransferase